MKIEVKLRPSQMPKINWADITTKMRQNGITLDQNGTFSGKKAKGTIKLSQDSVIVEVTDKPFYVPESAIESVVRKAINDLVNT